GDGQIGEFATNQDGSINNFGSPTSREGTEFYEKNEDEPATFRSEHSEKQSLNEKEEQSLQLSESPNLLASGYEDDARSNHSKPFLQQPSIEITPASDHKYVEYRGEDEPNSEHSQPMSPVGEESQQQQPPVEWRNYEHQDIHQEENRNNNNYQEQLIDFSSSPTAQGDEIIDISHQSQHSPHQNGHLKNYEDHENEDDENTSLLTYRTENEDSPSKKSNNNYKGENGHLLMGNGENSGRLSSSSTETEGADHENNNSDSSSVVIRQGTSTSLEHGQQHFQKLENEGRIEQL
uniref:RHD domain-containing protein n=1 Tax=Meloidogyne javanica TaxID=6303 RepID=A0A915MCB7_MELJA